MFHRLIVALSQPSTFVGLDQKKSPEGTLEQLDDVASLYSSWEHNYEKALATYCCAF